MFFILAAYRRIWDSPGGPVVKNLPINTGVLLPMQKTQASWVQFLIQEDLLEEGMATHSSTLAWKIPRTEEPDKLQFMGWQRVGQG